MNVLGARLEWPRFGFALGLSILILTLRMEKALSEPFRSICSRGGGVRVDFGQRLLLRLPARVFLHLV